MLVLEVTRLSSTSFFAATVEPVRDRTGRRAARSLDCSALTNCSDLAAYVPRKRRETKCSLISSGVPVLKIR
jgi:hypothetical protein